MNRTFSCCDSIPKYLITYRVAYEDKTYCVCEECRKLDCFSKHILRKEIIKNANKYEDLKKYD